MAIKERHIYDFLFKLYQTDSEDSDLSKQTDAFASALLGVLCGKPVYDFEKYVDCVAASRQLSDEEVLTWINRHVVDSWSGDGVKCLSWTGNSFVTCEIRGESSETS